MNLFYIPACLLATGWIWINDINSDGILNSTPESRDLTLKNLHKTMTESDQTVESEIKNDDDDDSIQKVPLRTSIHSSQEIKIFQYKL